jgi:hypothetical protein
MTFLLPTDSVQKKGKYDNNKQSMIFAKLIR